MIYTKDNPKLIENIYFFKNHETFSGVIKNKYHTMIYFLNGKFHREDGPAFEYVDGRKSWYLNGICYGNDNDFTIESWIRFVKLELLK